MSEVESARTAEPTPRGGHAGTGYWFADVRSDGPSAVDVLEQLRRYRSSNASMRLRVRDDMGMGQNDLDALRMVLRAEAAGAAVRQSELARTLDITPSSTSTLVDRLSRGGYVIRVPHPEDRRSVAVRVTQKAREEVQATLRAMHTRMLEVAESLTHDERVAVITFLSRLNHGLDASDPSESSHADSTRHAEPGPADQSPGVR